jgi:hypothetical protein
VRVDRRPRAAACAAAAPPAGQARNGLMPAVRQGRRVPQRKTRPRGGRARAFRHQCQVRRSPPISQLHRKLAPADPDRECPDPGAQRVVKSQVDVPRWRRVRRARAAPPPWHMSGEPIDSRTPRADSHCRTRRASIPASAAIRLASPAGWAASRSSQIEHVQQQVAGGVAGIGLGVDNQPRFRLRGQRGCLSPLLATRDRNAILSTRSALRGPVTGAVHEHCPPGWDGSPTRSDHRPARRPRSPAGPASTVQRRDHGPRSRPGTWAPGIPPWPKRCRPPAATSSRTGSHKDRPEHGYRSRPAWPRQADPAVGSHTV